MSQVTVEILAWVTRFVGGDGSGRRLFEELVAVGETVRDLLRRVSARYPELDAGEHIEVLVSHNRIMLTGVCR